MLFTKLGLESMPQRSYWVADTFFVEELQRSGDENVINLQGSTAAPPILSALNWTRYYVPAEGCHYCGVLVSTGNFFRFILSSSWGFFCAKFTLYSNFLIALQKSEQTKNPNHKIE